MPRRAKTQPEAVTFLNEFAAMVGRLQKKLEQAIVLSPKDAAAFSGVPESELRQNFRPVLIKTYTAKTKAGQIRKQKVGYRVSDLIARNERRLLA